MWGETVAGVVSVPRFSCPDHSSVMGPAWVCTDVLVGRLGLLPEVSWRHRYQQIRIVHFLPSGSRYPTLRTWVPHWISGFRTPPTIAIPIERSPSGSFERTMLLAGNMGLSGITCAASLAACSIASISSLQPAWSNGHTTMGWRRSISLADDICAYHVSVFLS
jgi:hypothetical protein